MYGEIDMAMPKSSSTCKPLYTRSEREAKYEEFYKVWKEDNQDIITAFEAAIDKALSKALTHPDYSNIESLSELLHSLRRLSGSYLNTKWDEHVEKLEEARQAELMFKPLNNSVTYLNQVSDVSDSAYPTRF